MYVYGMGGPVAWGCLREPLSLSFSSCKSEIYVTNEGTKTILTLRNLAVDLGLPDAETPTIFYNDNRGCVDWTKGASVSKKLRHLNMRELGVRLYQNLGAVTIQHIEGKKNVADIFTKEIKEPSHFRFMAFTLTTPRLLADWLPSHR
jgi:hypothetical protein